MTTERKLVLYISMSLDGFIATKADDISWLDQVRVEGEDYGYEEMKNRSDTYIIGRKTYEVVNNLLDGEFPQAQEFDCYVITRSARPSKQGITFYSGSISELINELKSKLGKDIYCDGGGEIVRLLMNENLIDEYIISIIPTILGSGKRLFLGDCIPVGLTAGAPKYFPASGLVQLHYKRSI